MKAAMFILDCSVTMAACLKDESSSYSTQVLDSLRHTEAFVPSLWLYEVGNTLLVAERKKRINFLQRQEYLRAIKSLPIQVCTSINLSELNEVISLGQSLNLSFYDASYLKLAILKNLPLATLDTKLQEAAKQAGVSTYLPA